LPLLKFQPSHKLGYVG